MKKFLYEVSYMVQFWLAVLIAAVIAHYLFPDKMSLEQITFGLLVVWIADLKSELKLEREKNVATKNEAP